MILDTLSIIVKNKMREKKISYDELSKITGVSKTYLTNIIGHQKIPRKNIIENMAKSLDIDPNSIKEYRLMKIFERLEKSYIYYTNEDFESVEKSIIYIVKKDNATLITKSGPKIYEHDLKHLEDFLILDLKEKPDFYKKFLTDFITLSEKYQWKAYEVEIDKIPKKESKDIKK